MAYKELPGLHQCVKQQPKSAEQSPKACGVQVGTLGTAYLNSVSFEAGLGLLEGVDINTSPVWR